MKHIIVILVSIVCLSICHGADAQSQTYAHNSVYLVSNPQTARWSYIERDSKGKHTLTIYNSVESVEGDGINGKLKIRIEEVSVESPEDTTRSYIYYRFKDGEFMTDTNAMLENYVLVDLFGHAIEKKYSDLSEDERKKVIEQIKSQFKISGEIRGIPRFPKVGKLPDYEYQFKFSIMSMKVTGEERRIVGTERIQTEAGTFDCFILEETITTKAMMMKDVEKIRSWYAYGIGLVKEITYDKKGKLISTMMLN